MRILLLDAVTAGSQNINLGKQGENKATRISFDVSQLVDMYGDGNAMLLIMRSEDSAPYVVETSRSENIISWDVDSVATLYNGDGKMELRWLVDDVIVKTIVFTTHVKKSIVEDAVLPSPMQSWFDALIEYIDEHAASPEQIEEAVARYLDEHPIEAPVTSVNDMLGDVVITAEDLGALTEEDLEGAIELALARAKASGEFDGADGVSPTVSVEVITGGHEVTITDAAHPSGQSFNVMDGTDGADGQDYILTSADKSDIADMVIGGGATFSATVNGQKLVINDTANGNEVEY